MGERAPPLSGKRGALYRVIRRKLRDRNRGPPRKYP